MVDGGSKIKQGIYDPFFTAVERMYSIDLDGFDFMIQDISVNTLSVVNKYDPGDDGVSLGVNSGYIRRTCC